MRPREGPENRTIAEIERLGEIINNPVEEADWESDRVLLEGINESYIGTMARKWHAAYRKAQNSNLVRQKEKEFLLEEHAKAREMASKNRCLSKQQAARIQELEDALVEERARGNHYGMEYDDAIEGEIERWIIDGEKDSPKFYLDRVREEARRQLRAEGKIGPDAKPRSWQITDERLEALQDAINRYVHAKSLATYTMKRRKGVLRAMLEAGQE